MVETTVYRLSWDDTSNDIGKCNVCWNLICGEVRMCPLCSCILCNECLNRLQKVNGKPKCVQCRQYSHDFSRVRQMEEMISNQLLKKKDECERHQLEKVYYCNECAITVCPSCFYDEPGHEGHTK